MIDLSFWFGVLGSAAGIIGGGLGVASFVREVNQSRKADVQQKEQADLARRQADALERQADAQEATAVQPNETAMQGWTRALVNARLATARNTTTKRIQDEITPLAEKLSELDGKINTTVTASQYLTHQGNMYKMVAEGEQIRSEIYKAISAYQRQGVSADEIQSKILTAIGSELLRMAETLGPLPNWDTEEREQSNG